QAIFKDARMREQTGLIKIEVVRLLEDVGRLKDRVLDLQRHFSQANSDLEKLGVSADKITKRGLRIEQLDLAEPPRITADDGAKLRLVSPELSSSGPNKSLPFFLVWRKLLTNGMTDGRRL